MNDYDKKHTELAAIAKNFSTKWTNAHEAVMKQSKELASAKRDLKKRTLELCDYKAKKLIEQAHKMAHEILEQRKTAAWIT